MKNLKEIIQEKLNRTKSSLMLEKLKVNSKSKVNNNYNGLDNFVEYIENNTSFGKPLLEVKNNKIRTGKFYNVSNSNDKIAIYLFPLYITIDEKYCLGICLAYKTNDQNENYCTLKYVIGTTNKSNKLHVDKFISLKNINDFDDDINFDKYLDIIKKLYKASKRMHPNDFLLKYEKIVDENNK